MGRRVSWSPEDVRILRRDFSSTPTPKLARRLRRDEGDVEREAKRYALSKNKRLFEGQAMPRWTPEELETLRALYPTTSNLVIARQLGRSMKSVVSKASGLGLRKDETRLVEMGRENVLHRRRSTGSVTTPIH